MPDGHRIYGAIGDLLHAPLFGLLTFGLLGVIERLWPIAGWTRSLLLRTILVGAAVFIVSVGVEIAQEWFGRTGTLHDAVSNAAGISAACGLFVLWRSRSVPHGRVADSPRRRRLTALVLAGVMVSMTIGWYEPISRLKDITDVYRKFPLLGSFESKYELQRWHFRAVHPRRTSESPADGKACLEMVVKGVAGEPGPDTCGTTLFELDHDWSDMAELTLSLRVDSNSPTGKSADPVRVLIKVVDAAALDPDKDAFQAHLNLACGGWEQIKITRDDITGYFSDRVIDLSQIRYLDVFLIQPPTQSRWWLDDIRLTMREDESN